MDSLVDVDWLAAHLDDPDLVVLDCSVVVDMDAGTNHSGRADYEAGHIPGAGFADLFGDLDDPDVPIGFAVPAPEVFAAAMGRLGVGDDTRVVLYDSSLTMWAARVWWMLRWIGFDDAALLDGGLRAWTAAGHPLDSGPPRHPARALSVRLRPELIVDADEVLAAIDDPAVRLVDTLPAAHFRGERAMYARPGHIPGAVNEPVFSLIGQDGRFRSPEEIDTVLGGDRSGRAITYCGGGIAASGNAFAMVRAGFTDVAVYTASLQEWAADPTRPLVTGDE